MLPSAIRRNPSEPVAPLVSATISRYPTGSINLTRLLSDDPHSAIALRTRGWTGKTTGSSIELKASKISMPVRVVRVLAAMNCRQQVASFVEPSLSRISAGFGVSCRFAQCQHVEHHIADQVDILA